MDGVHSRATPETAAPKGPHVSDRLRLMCVHAHPDDESSKGAATMARYVDEGHEVLVVSCTGGERGDVLNPRLKDDVHILRDLAQVRRDEMAAAREILGVQHTWLGFVDSGLPEGDPLPPLPEGCFALEPLDVTTEALVREIRRFRPHVVTTYDENGGYPHPDHVMCHDVSMAAVVAAGDPDGLPARRPGLAAAEGLLQPDLQPGPHRGLPRGAHRAGRGEPVRRVARELVAPRPRRDHPRRVRGLVRAAGRRAARPRDPGRPRRHVVPRLARGAGARCGRPRTTRRPCPSCPIAEGEDDLFAGIPTDLAAADALATSGDLTVVLDTRTEREA